MKKIQLYAVALAAALLPAALGLWGNASFSEDIPVRVPVQAKPTPGAVLRSVQPTRSPRPAAADDHGRRHGGHGADDPMATPTHASSAEPREDHGRNRGSDDHGTDDHGTDDQTHEDRTADRHGSGGSSGSGSGSDDRPAEHGGDDGDHRGGESGESGGSGGDDGASGGHGSGQ